MNDLRFACEVILSAAKLGFVPFRPSSSAALRPCPTKHRLRLAIGMKETHPLAVVDGVTYVNLLELEGLAKTLLTPNAYGYYSGGAEVLGGSRLYRLHFALARNAGPQRCVMTHVGPALLTDSVSLGSKHLS